ncbi:MAG: sel1 repeat family protein [Pseudomonadota bacterium]|nr:sel1 repeat family protein [Pseudomonadota bacterium]
MLSPSTRHMRALFTLVCCALPVWAYAIAAATQEEILCNSGQVVVADVISGKSADCRLQYRDCSPHDSGWLQIHIVDVLAVGDDAAFRRFGAAMKDSKFTEVPHAVRTTPVVTNQIVEVSVRIFAPLDAPLTDALVIERFRGKRLLLSLSFGGGVLPLLESTIDESGTEKGPTTRLPAGSDLYAQIWPAEQREWIEKTIVDRNGEDCPKVITINGRSAITYKPPVTEADIIAEKLRLGPDDSYAWFDIGNWYINGEHGLKKSPQDAALWYLKAAAQGNYLAQRSIGEMFEFGEGVPPDHDKALEWMRKADIFGPSAALSIAKKHEGGRGYPKDLKRAEEWYLLGADRGFAEAQNELGEFYEACGDQYLADALRWYHKAAASVPSSSSNTNTAASKAMANLAKLYASGKGVPQDYAEAAKWYQRSINSGGYWGQYGLAVLYEQGLGVPKDANKALGLYYEVALLNDEALRRLFMLFEKGMNIPAEDINAIAWYRAAAEKGDVRAQVGLGLHYKFHKGVEKNWSVAYALFNLAKLSSSEEPRHIPDFSGPAVTAEIYMTPATWTLVHAMAKPGNLLKALDQFIAHPPTPVNSAIYD